jgi:1-acyl-sn-glycerol-3-phosphate acyltransferase
MQDTETLSMHRQHDPTARRKTVIQHLSSACLSAWRWRVELVEPLPPQCIIIGAHHTSWLDLMLTLLFMGATGLRFHWVGKESLFRGPVGWLLRRLGGISVRRGARAHFVDQMVTAFQRGGPLRIAISPEGTRRHVSHWKTGFYYIALGAKVPVALGYADFHRRRVGVGPLLTPTGDIDADFQRYRDFYAAVTGLHPERQGDVRRADDDGNAAHPQLAV